LDQGLGSLLGAGEDGFEVEVGGCLNGGLGMSVYVNVLVFFEEDRYQMRLTDEDA